MRELSIKAVETFEKWAEKNNLTGKTKEEAFEKFKLLVQKTSYEPGEAVGIISAQSISEPATQMCIDFHEKVIVKCKDNVGIVTIGEFVDSVLYQGFVKSGEYEILDLPDGIEVTVPSLNEKNNIEWKIITALCRIKSPKSLLKITTKSGKTVTATDSHSFVVKVGDKARPIEGKNLKLGDKVPVLNKTLSPILTTESSNGLLLRTNSPKDISTEWDEIISIDRVKPSTEYVYDMTVKDNHTFAISNGIVVHNTMRSYTLATQRDHLSKVTQGLPRLIEIFDVRKTFEKNMKIFLHHESC